MIIFSKSKKLFNLKEYLLHSNLGIDCLFSLILLLILIYYSQVFIFYFHVFIYHKILSFYQTKLFFY